MSSRSNSEWRLCQKIHLNRDWTERGKLRSLAFTTMSQHGHESNLFLRHLHVCFSIAVEHMAAPILSDLSSHSSVCKVKHEAILQKFEVIVTLVTKATFKTSFWLIYIKRQEGFRQAIHNGHFESKEEVHLELGSSWVVLWTVLLPAKSMV